MKSKFNLGLLPKVLIAIACGIGVGTIAPMWLARIFATFNAVFSEFLGFVIPLLIVGFVAPAIFEIGSKAGRMLVVTALIAYAMTFASGMMSYFISELTFPSMITPDAYVASQAESVSVAPYFTVEIEPLMNVMTALVLAFVLGLCLSAIDSSALRNVLLDFRKVINLTISKVIIPLLPIYIFGIFMSMTITGEVSSMLKTFAGIIAVIFAMHVALLILQYVIASLFSGLNPFKALWRMMPAYFTALGTQSSAATIPVTLRQTVALGVDKETAGFVIPLCATIHMSGSTLKIVACALALMITHSMPYSTPMFAGFIAMLGITIVAAPGVPGGAIMASLGLLSSMLGFTDADNALMIALYIAMDSFGTACNVTGDGAIAQIVARIFRHSPVRKSV
ncbi:MAG: dicarboxylate/amino acid:cation symporter [Muribaculaceae bacterium]|nr:dicarboxylate/amino acid:cation symporter [Muribaculaceae bacterium]